MLKKIKKLFSALRFGQRLFLILILFSLVPLLTIQQMLMRVYENRIVQSASESTLSVVKANNTALNSLLNSVETTSQLMLDNELYYSVFSRLHTLTVGDMLRYERIISNEISKQFTAQDTIASAYLLTSRWIFGNAGVTVPVTLTGAKSAGYDQIGHNADGMPAWITGYDYGKATNSSYLLQKEDYEARFPITMVREMSFQYSSMGTYEKLSDDAEKPVLVVQILESRLRRIYNNSLHYEGSLYAIANSSGTVISSDNDDFPVGSALPDTLASLCQESGFQTVRHNGSSFLLCYDALPDKGLFSFAFIPMDVLIENALARIRQIQLLCMLLLILLSVAVAFWLSRTISRPIAALTKAAARVAGGDFSANTPVPGGGDFKRLTESFNHMEREITRLIHENYEISLQEKETRLMALSMQINPHFLYNTLNTINMLAIQNEDDETSELIVDLSEMLQYTFQSTSEKAPLSEEINWMSNYLYIMSRRYDNLFCTQMDIAEDLTDCKVPKFILQPLAENAILHGFSGRKEGGILKLSILRDGSDIRFQIEDNGKGMDAAELERYTIAITQDGHVGISNVHRRLSLLYGEAYRIEVKSSPGQGTCIRIWLPFEKLC